MAGHWVAVVVAALVIGLLRIVPSGKDAEEAPKAKVPVAILLFEGVELLDFAGPAEVLASANVRTSKEAHGCSLGFGTVSLHAPLPGRRVRTETGTTPQMAHRDMGHVIAQRFYIQRSQASRR